MQTRALRCSNRTHDALGKGNCQMGKRRRKNLLTGGATYKLPALPGDIYTGVEYDVRCYSNPSTRHWNR
jgi:hypothetical protein